MFLLIWNEQQPVYKRCQMCDISKANIKSSNAKMFLQKVDFVERLICKLQAPDSKHN